jgi:hypothetical protein
LRANEQILTRSFNLLKLSLLLKITFQEKLRADQVWRRFPPVSVLSVIQNHKNANVRNIGQGEARHRKYKRLKLGGGQAYDRSRD